MGYQSQSISQVIPKINDSIFLPAIQREFVWDTDQIVQLFDSVLREYPIGSFIFWEVDGEFAAEQVKYRFVQNYIEDSIYPSEFNDVNHRNQKFTHGHSNLPDSISLVVDGQQRLSSFYIGLRGMYVEKEKYRHRTTPDAWNRKELYMNLLSDPDQETDDQLKLRYEFRFKRPDPDHAADEYWFPVGEILELDTLGKTMDRAEEIGDTLDEAAAGREGYIHKNLHHLYNAIHSREIINYYQESRQDNERILDVFVRANEGGTQLSKSEILLSIATSYWTTDEDNPIDAKDAINLFVEGLNEDYIDEGYDFGTDFVLKSLLVAADLSAEYKIRVFTKENLALMKDIWVDGEVQNAIRSTVRLISEFGLTGRSLTSRNALIPIIYYFYENGNPTLTIDSQQGNHSRRRIFHWLCSALLNSNFNSRPDQIIEDARAAIQKAPSEEFPLEQIQRDIRARGKAVGFSEEILEDLFEETDYRSNKIYLLLSLIYYPGPARGRGYEIDHIFPRSMLDKGTLIDEHGFDAATADRFEELRDHVGNLQLIRDNRGKSDEPFADWIDTRTDEYYDRHHIPTDPELFELENFPAFVQQRTALIRQHILETFGETESAPLAE